MDLVQDLFVTAFVAILLSFLVAKLVSITVGSDAASELCTSKNDHGEVGVVMEEKKFGEKMQVEGLEAHKKVEFVEVNTKRVDQFETEESVHADEVGLVGWLEEKNSSIDDLSLEKVVDFDEEEVKEKNCNDPSVKDSILDGEIQEEVTECDDVKVKEENCDNLGVDDKGLDDDTEEDKDVLRSGEVKEGDEEKELVTIDEDDDWEGIERSELEKDFAAAAAFVGGDGDKGFRLANIENDVQTQLYGLHKIAMEGPCHEPQPMALKMSARAKWNAWQKMGNMDPEEAMEQYIAILSDKVPGWMEDNPSLEGQSHTLESDISGIPDPNSSLDLHHQPSITNERKPELISNTDDVDTCQTSHSLEKD